SCPMVSTLPRPPSAALFPYTTLFRSGMGRHGPELLAQPAGPGLPGVFDYRLCGDLRRTGAEHRHRGGHHHGDLELRGLYRAAVLHTVQNWQSRESSVSGALSQEGGNAKWLMYPYPKT